MGWPTTTLWIVTFIVGMTLVISYVYLGRP